MTEDEEDNLIGKAGPWVDVKNTVVSAAGNYIILFVFVVFRIFVTIS